VKQEANPAIIAVVVVLTLLLIGFMGWKFLGPGSKSESKDPYGSGGRAHYEPHSGGGMGGPGSGGMGGPGSGGFGSGGQ
jgi:hypothetical protein